MRRGSRINSLIRSSVASRSSSLYLSFPHIQRFYSSSSISNPSSISHNSEPIPTEAIVARYHQHGDPNRVIKLETERLPQSLESNQILYRMMMAPIHPSDINMIEGTYPITPNVPAVGGNEGVAEIISVGSSVSNQSNLSVGDWVVPASPGFGTWRTYGVTTADRVLKVPQDIKPEYASSIFVNPCTAYRLLNDFVDLKEGDVVIQNAGNSAVGSAVHQLGAMRGIKVISVIRDRPDYDNVSERMKHFGSHLVIKDTDFLRGQSGGLGALADLMSDLPKPKLALNCVGGPIATEMARWLGHGGVMVTYGGMSRRPVQIPTSLLIFKNITLKGFWLSKWVDDHSVSDRMGMVKEVWDLVRQKKFRMWMERYMFKDLNAALKRTNEDFTRDRKVVLVMKPHAFVNREEDD